MDFDFTEKARAAETMVQWVRRNADQSAELQGKSKSLSVSLARSAAYAYESRDNLKRRPVVGLFGASQAGKSYLVSSLAAGRRERLITDWDGLGIDFIRHVNPSGNDSEATGFATRFTLASAQSGKNPAGFPVKLALLKECEIAMIMINAFFCDINQADVRFSLSEEDLLRHLDDCEQYVDREAAREDLEYSEDSKTFCRRAKGEFNGFSFTDCIALADYTERNSKGKVGGIEDLPAFWMRLAEMMPYMTLEGRVKALSVLWQNLTVFTETYRVLASELLKTGGAVRLFAPKEAFVTGAADGSVVQNADGTIMHITKLGKIFSDTDSLKCMAEKEDGSFQECTLNLSRLAALSLELEFALKSSGGLRDFDVLDLPGARSRDVIRFDDVKKDGESFDGTNYSVDMQRRGTEFFRRGKVAFLFDRYARRGEIEQLLFCIGVNAQQDVIESVTVLTDWIETNVGKTPELRNNGYNPLTIVFSRYDEVFSRQLKNLNNGLPLDMNQEINIAINRIQKMSWFTEWTPGRPFNRIYPARKPNLGDINTWIETDENGEEIAFSAKDADSIGQIREALLGVKDFNVHIADFSDRLDDMLLFNDGGVTAILKCVQANALSEEKRKELRVRKAELSLEKVAAELNIFAVRDAASALEQARKDGVSIGMSLLQCNELYPCLSLYREHLEISRDRLEQLYLDGFSSGSNVHRFVRAVIKEYEEKLDSLRRHDNTYLLSLAEAAAQVYSRNLENIKANPASFNSGSFFYISDEKRLKTAVELKADIVALFNRVSLEISRTFSSGQVGIQKYMSDRLMETENVNEGLGDALRRQVQIMSFILSDFNMYLGSDLLKNEGESAEEDPAEKAAEETENALQKQSAQSNGAPPAFVYDDEDDFFFAGNAQSAPSAYSLGIGAGSDGRDEENTAHELIVTGDLLGTPEGPYNFFSYSKGRYYADAEKQDYSVYDYDCETDSTKCLPHLNEESSSFEKKFLTDYCSTLSYMMCRINIMQESRFNFSARENMLLCHMLEIMECSK